MMQLAASAASQAAALIKMDGLNLVLPQGDIRTLEPASDVDTASPALNSTGWIIFQQKRWPVYCLSEDLDLLRSAPASRRACAMLSIGTGYMGLLCNDVVVLKEFESQMHEVPVAMRMPHTPVMGLSEHAQGIACISNASRLTAYIEKLVSAG